MYGNVSCMEDIASLSTGQIVRYTSPDGQDFDAIVVQVLPDGNVQVRYQAEALRRTFAVVKADTLSVPR